MQPAESCLERTISRLRHNPWKPGFRFQQANDWFPLDRNGIVTSCDSSSFWLIVETLTTIENQNITVIEISWLLSLNLS